MAALERTRLLILDDWGPEPFNAEQRRDLLEIVDDRYDRGSLIITSQLPLGRWHEVIGDPTLADGRWMRPTGTGVSRSSPRGGSAFWRSRPKRFRPIIGS